MYSKNRSSTERVNPEMSPWWVTYTSLSVMLVLIISLIIYPAASPAASPRLSAEPLLILPTVRPDDPGETTRNYHSGTGMVRFLAPSQPGSALAQPAPLDPSAPAEAAARYFLNVYGKWFGVLDPQRELKLLRTRESLDRGRSSVRFQQAYQGIPVLAGEMIVNLDAAKNVTSVSGKVLPDISFDPTSQVDSSTAQATALQAVAKWYQVPEYDLEVSPATPWIYNPVLLSSTKGLTALVWRMEVKARGLAPIRELVLVDAQKGNIVLHFNQVDSAKSLKTYTMGGSSVSGNLPGTLVCTYPNDLSCAAGDSDAKAAHDYASDTYNFYLNTYGRDSIDGAGMLITSSVHFGVNYQNAFWDGQQMVYGDGFSAADDVVGHELTHGVTERESHLFYYYQSGAINESFSDVWGEFVDLSNGKGTDTAGVRWLIGEDIPGIGAIRSMSNPPQFSDPDKITSANYYLGANDQGGVHTNSGVNNKAAYLMTDGASFNGFAVTGLGIQKVAKVYYEAQTNLLTSGSDYADLYDALRQACTNLVGTAGITSGDCTQVKNALDAVEMNQQPVAGFNPDAPLCPSGQQVSAQPFFDNVEAGGGKWTTSTLSGTNNPWSLISEYATSSTHSFWASDINSVSDSVLTMANSVVVPAGAYLHFRHAFGFESGGSSYFDGGVVEYSTNNGNTWTDLSGLFVDGQTYGGSLSTGYSNPLGGRSAFVADSHGYVSSRYNLASLAGQNLRVRFRQATDSIGSGPLGWVVDDVRIYNCAVVIPTYTLTVAKAGTGSGTVGGGGSYAAGATVALIATPNAGSVFAGWSPSPCAASFAMPASNLTCTATFTLNTYTLTVAKAGTGSGTVGGGGTFPYNTLVTPTATAATGSTFTGWSPVSCGAPFNLTANTTCTATFSPVPTYTLTVAKAGAGSGTVGGGGSYAAGATVALTATPEAGSVFAGWSPSPCAASFAMPASNLSCTATFNPAPPVTYTLTVAKAGAGSGTVGGGGSYAAGATVALTATPEAGSVFAGWSPSPCAASFAMPASNLSCTATFNPAPPVTYTLTVAKAGAGSGTVGGGGSYAAGATVALTATPEAGSVFAGWSPSPCAASFAMPASNLSCTATFNPSNQTPAQHTVGLFSPGTSTFYLKNSPAGGAADIVFGFGPPNAGWTPLVGDWDGNGTATAGLFSPATSTFYLKNSHGGGAADIVFGFGPPNAGWIPLVGDWDGNGTATVGLFSPATSTFYLKNSHAGGAADIVFGFGPPNAGWTPLAGDWDGNGSATVGLFSPATSTFYLKNSHAGGAADLVFGFGPANAGWTPLVGDWDGNGSATVGLFSPATSTFYLKNNHAGGAADIVFGFGPANAGWTPLAGDWNGPGS